MPEGLNAVEGVADREIARSLRARLVGLIGRDHAPAGGLLIERCNCIHTLFMRFPIDAAFLDAEGRTVRKICNIRPGRLFVWGGWRARSVLETEAK